MIILGKKTVGRKETLEYANKKLNWPARGMIGISCFFGFWAWLQARMNSYDTKCIYYCIDFYSPKVFTGWWDKIFIPLAIRMDKFLCKHADEVWDISPRINEGRREFGGYTAKSKIVPLSYPPDYFRFEHGDRNKIAFVGLAPYGLELLDDYTWLRNLPLKELLSKLSQCGIGYSMWKEKGNNYYGDPGKTKLYSACGLPVIMTANTPYASIIKKTHAGIVIPYNKESVKYAYNKIINNYSYYKKNVKKTWEYINADEVFRLIKILD